MTDLDLLLTAYADGALDADGIAAAEAILAADPRARHIVEIHRETTALLRSACAEEMYAKGALRAPIRRTRGLRLPALAVAASVAALLLGFAAGQRLPPDGGFLADVAEYHGVYEHETAHLTELAADQPEEIARWFGTRLGRAVAAPDLQSAGLRFAGARMLVSDGQPVADLLYTRANGLPVGLCIGRAESAAATAMTVSSSDGLRLAAWQRGGYVFAVVGELSAEAARAIAEQAARQLGG